MHVITRKPLQSFAAIHKDSAKSLDAWYKTANSAKWKNFEELKEDFGTADVAGELTVFNIKGNHYRLIADVQYQKQVIFIKYVLTHKEYDKNEWKQDPYY